MRRLMMGECDKQIAESLGISHSTVRTHLARIFASTGASDRLELILLLFSAVLRLVAESRRIERGGSHNGAASHGSLARSVRKDGHHRSAKTPERTSKKRQTRDVIKIDDRRRNLRQFTMSQAIPREDGQ
jgi:DNA-binding CsgD family transcriptional regulator